MRAPPDPDHPLTASCACGAVTVTLKARPRSMFHCACLDCQQASGGGHLPLIMMREADVEIAGATTAHQVVAASGAITTRHFCPICGSRIFGGSARSPGNVLVPVGLFGASADWFAPRSVIFARSLLHWDAIDAAIPRYDTYRS
ncbi:MAG: GFA family protein, partial [Cucumibacter sp.]